MTASGSYLIPAFQHARVADAMRPGVISCPPDSSMRDVARIMTSNHIHAVVVRGVAEGGAWGVVTDRDLLAAASGRGGSERRRVCIGGACDDRAGRAAGGRL